MKIIVDNKIPFIKGRLEPLGEVVYADPFGFTPQLVRDADALIIRTRTRCDADLLEGSDVKLVATATIGTDQIDIPWCESNGITVENAAGCNAPGVAQYVWSALLRNGFDPSRHTLGVVGKGNIGSIVADWGRRLGAKVIVSDPPRRVRGLTDENYLPLEVLLSEADAVTLHTPLTRTGEHSTFHLISEKELKLMKPGSILINAARGPVVDNTAWSLHLANGDAKGVVDVWEGEPHIDPLLLGRALIATPHIAGYSREGKERATRMVLEAVERKFGVSLDKSGLTGAYQPPLGSIAASPIIESYNPAADTAALRDSPGDFEKLRSDYHYRDEVSF